MFVPARYANRMLALVRFAPVRSAPSSFVFVSVTFFRFALLSFALVRTAPPRFAPSKLQPLPGVEPGEVQSMPACGKPLQTVEGNVSIFSLAAHREPDW